MRPYAAIAIRVSGTLLTLLLLCSGIGVYVFDIYALVRGQGGEFQAFFWVSTGSSMVAMGFSGLGAYAAKPIRSPSLLVDITGTCVLFAVFAVASWPRDNEAPGTLWLWLWLVLGSLGLGYALGKREARPNASDG